MQKSFIIFTFFLIHAPVYGQKHVSFGLNIAWEGIVASEDYYIGFNMNAKKSIDVTYNSNVVSIGIGMSIFNENYYFNEPMKYGAELDYYFENLGIPLNFSVDFTKKSNTLFLGLNNELVYSTYAIKTEIRSSNHGIISTISVLNETKYSYWNFQMGLGYKFKIVSKLNFKLFIYKGENFSSKNNLDDVDRLSRYGAAFGLFYKIPLKKK